MFIDSTDEVGRDVDRVLWKSQTVLFEACHGDVRRLGLIRVEQQFHAVHGWVAPADLGTPFELGRITLVVEDEGWDFRLSTALVACEMEVLAVSLGMPATKVDST